MSPTSTFLVNFCKKKWRVQMQVMSTDPHELQVSLKFVTDRLFSQCTRLPTLTKLTATT
jgi:hypothetical protein